MSKTVKAVVIAAALLCAPATAAAAEKPVVAGGAATGVTDTAVVLNGTVTPKGAETTYYFQYGTSSLYGAVTPAGTVPVGSGRVKVTAAVTGLAPVTTYHYRLVAQNSVGVARGNHRTFKTKPKPLAFSIAATPNPVAVGGATTLAGVLDGTFGGRPPDRRQEQPVAVRAGVPADRQRAGHQRRWQLLGPGARRCR